MSDPQLPPPDPDDVERDDAEEGEHRDPADNPAVAGVGPALLVPPLPSTDPDRPDEDDEDDEADAADEA